MRILSRNIISFLLLSFLISGGIVSGQDTFSIVAIDSVNGLFGSAGASCVGSSGSYPHGAAILSDVIPGIGVIHTQAAWNHINQDNAHNWMMLGLSPQQIIDSLVANDAQNNSTTRQYGIVDFNGGHPRSAAFTGTNCQNYKNDTAHLNYSIQGNILMGQKILDSMQTRFLNTAGTLADRLMAALQGAKVIGADTRCFVRNTSSQSAFLRVGRMTDSPDSLYLDLWMAYPQNYSGPFPVDPIDSLQVLYDIWKTAVPVRDHLREPGNYVKISRGEDGKVVFDLTQVRDYPGAGLTVYDILGRELISSVITSRLTELKLNPGSDPRLLIYSIKGKNGRLIATGKFIF